MEFWKRPEFSFVICILVIAVFAFFVIRSYMKKLKSGCCGAGGDAPDAHRVKVADKNPAHYPHTVILTIDGMVCSHCAERVENALNVLPEVWAKADVSAKTATVRTKRQPDTEALRKAVNAIGPYTVMKIDTKA